MCGMRVCEWTQQEPTLDIRFMGGDYDPGRSGRNREKDSKTKANGRDEVEKENGAEPWNEVFDLHRTGQLLLVDCLIWVFIMSTHNGKGQWLIVICIFICHIPPSLPVHSQWMFFLFLFLILWEIYFETSPGLQSLSKVSWEALGFTLGFCCIFKCFVILSPFILIDALCGTVSTCRRKIRASEMKTSPPSLRWHLYVAVSSSGLPVGVWSWQHATVFDL